ncbi:MAG: valine--tRNA ligase [Candidatus ainarchaeum sp.]|nr:valine--tRNA ligase [Candidatus ainarchaeum sp.]
MLGKFNREYEKEYLSYWAEKNIYSFNPDDKRPIYSIDTPPPFTSGELHMGHALSYAFFDFVARYKRMRGFNVFYPQGWDTQGFPTEVKVEKKYGRLPPVEFRKKCVEWTKEFISIMKNQMNELGFSPDWNYEYRTMDPEYHKKVQYSLIEMYKQSLVYRGKHPVFWCPKCSSAIAKAETEESQKNGILNYILFTGPKRENLQIATTRPELMHACVAVMFHPSDEKYKYLEGKEITTALGKKVKVIADADVEKDFGTGLLMVCTFGDIQDVVWTHRHSLEIIEAIDERGKLINSGEFDGLKTEEARKKIIEKLKAEGKISKQENLSQNVKVHDRCKTQIELKNSLQWFAKIKENKEKIKESARKIKWIPSFGISYLEDWANNVDWDWCISRHRVFGTPLPFYNCPSCEYNEPVEYSKLPFYPENLEIKKCPKCQEIMEPEKTVADCWVDSSITPLIISKWKEDEKFFNEIYPIDLRPQGVEIVRTWAFYTIYRSSFLTGKPPFKSILLNGNVLAPDGKKMSKSLGNIISPLALKEKYPVDAIRQWAALSGAMAKDRPFSYEDLNRSKSFILKLWNASAFIEQNLENKIPKKPEELRLLDLWILSRLNLVIKQCTEHMENFEFHHALQQIHIFFWNDLCDNYLEYVKYRIYGNTSKESAQYVLYHVLLNSLKLLAPISVFTTEKIFQEVFSKDKSIHSEKWPEKLDVQILSEQELTLIELFNKIVSELRQHKASNRMALNSELKKVILTMDLEFPQELLEDLKQIMNITILEIKKGKYSLHIE